MGRYDKAKQAHKTGMARRDFALGRIELRGPSEARESPASVTSFPVKSRDPEIERMIEEALAKRTHP